MNESVGTPKNCIALSHARRFGKSHAAGMVDAYYSLGCDSTTLFEHTEIASRKDYKKYMNKYNVIHIDVSSFWDYYKDNMIQEIASDSTEQEGLGLAQMLYEQMKRNYGL